MEDITNLDVRLIASLIGITGIFVTAVLSSIAYFYKVNSETKKSARKVLYLLLEIRHEILNSLFDPEKETKSYIEHCENILRNNGITSESKEMYETISLLISTHFQNLYSATKTDIHDRLLVPFEAALLEFSTIKPVLAYRLKGKEKLEAVISHTNSYSENYKELISKHVPFEWLQELFLSSSTEAKEETLAELITSLDSDILLLAEHCGSSDLKASKEVLNNEKKSFVKNDYSEVDKWIETMLVRISDAENRKKA